MVEKRQFGRKPFDETVYCTVTVLDVIDTKVLNLAARGVDISEGGIGIKADYPLESGQVLRLQNISLPKHVGVVRWSRNSEGKGIYRAGVQFV